MGCPITTGFAAGEVGAGCATGSGFGAEATDFAAEGVAAGFAAGAASCTSRRFFQASADGLSCANDVLLPASKEVPASPTAATPPNKRRAERVAKIIPKMMSPNRSTLDANVLTGCPYCIRLVTNNGHIRAKL